MADQNNHSNGNGNGMSRRQWRMVRQRVHWIQFGLYLLCSALTFAAIGGAYVTAVDNRIERNRDHLERVDITISSHREQLAGMRASQSATETAAARLEERLSAQAETLNRIENLLERLLSESYNLPPRK